MTPLLRALKKLESKQRIADSALGIWRQDAEPVANQSPLALAKVVHSPQPDQVPIPATPVEALQPLPFWLEELSAPSADEATLRDFVDDFRHVPIEDTSLDATAREDTATTDEFPEEIPFTIPFAQPRIALPPEIPFKERPLTETERAMGILFQGDVAVKNTSETSSDSVATTGRLSDEGLRNDEQSDDLPVEEPPVILEGAAVFDNVRDQNELASRYDALRLEATCDNITSQIEALEHPVILCVPVGLHSDQGLLVERLAQQFAITHGITPVVIDVGMKSTHEDINAIARLEQLRATCPLIILQADSVESLSLAPWVASCDAVYLLVDIAQTARRQVYQAIDRLNRLQARVSGCILVERVA